ncbi:MAG: CooT family nickel-binding protein [Deltaproteobacteria bacterium]|nr:CooT family nickel-binding protein [Deltaproteobacteria bacterium]MBW2016074.1 CooT family nickel-binding protein [Deltaproteobacteria bacterium]MBW2130471.1 CooT family nickel-binding protein [Deltaproteobacteria bacterium]MBW2305101.1 CooT family nickel-binding protein [Deltaproteobacteria bacterium]
MCEAHAYLLKNGVEELVLENVDEVEVEGDQVKMINIFGEQRILSARITKYLSREGKILLLPA